MKAPLTVTRIRQRIDALDEALVRLLNRRARLARGIGHLKRATADEIYVPAREKMVLAHVARANRGPLTTAALAAIYREIMSASLALEQRVRVAFLGPPSTFTHQAARARFGASVAYVDCQTIRDVFAAVEKQEADYGVVPIENSTDGAVIHTLDEFADTPLKICAEIYLRIAHHIMAKTRRGPIRRILSKPEVFGQCRHWLQAHYPRAELIPETSTAKAAERAAREPGTAAIASALAAERYGLKVLTADIQDWSGNTTRFLVIGRRFGKATGHDKTSILFSVKHRAGALHDALKALKTGGLNMTKIESRPSRQKAWEYWFFVDFEGHADDPRVRRALRALERHCTFLTVLGAYPNVLE